jgi:hypothetical protein
MLGPKRRFTVLVVMQFFCHWFFGC